MHSIRLIAVVSILLMVTTGPAARSAGPAEDEARLLRFPDIHRGFVVFVHAGEDPSLQKAVEVLLNEHERKPHGHPDAPEPPDMSR